MKSLIRNTEEWYVEENKRLTEIWFKEGGDLEKIIEKYASQRFKDYINRSIDE